MIVVAATAAGSKKFYFSHFCVVGSRYHMPLSRTNLDFYLSLPISLFVKNTVDNFTYATKAPLLLTHSEFSIDIHSTIDTRITALWDILPAWYILK
jgi:hypothetical protein